MAHASCSLQPHANTPPPPAGILGLISLQTLHRAVLIVQHCNSSRQVHVTHLYVSQPDACAVVHPPSPNLQFEPQHRSPSTALHWQLKKDMLYKPAGKNVINIQTTPETAPTRA
jgi:hypothetical protein